MSWVTISKEHQKETKHWMFHKGAMGVDTYLPHVIWEKMSLETQGLELE